MNKRTGCRKEHTFYEKQYFQGKILLSILQNAFLPHST